MAFSEAAIVWLESVRDETNEDSLHSRIRSIRGKHTWTINERYKQQKHSGQRDQEIHLTIR